VVQAQLHFNISKVVIMERDSLLVQNRMPIVEAASCVRPSVFSLFKVRSISLFLVFNKQAYLGHNLIAEAILSDQDLLIRLLTLSVLRSLLLLDP
jgi:hypothetical protein